MVAYTCVSTILGVSDLFHLRLEHCISYRDRPTRFTSLLVDLKGAIRPSSAKHNYSFKNFMKKYSRQHWTENFTEMIIITPSGQSNE